MADTYYLYRITTNLVADNDAVLIQTAPAGNNVVLRMCPERRVTKIEFVLEWIDANADPVLGGRGTFTARIVRRMVRDAAAQGLAGAVDLWVDVADLTAIPAYRPFLVSDIQKWDEIAVLLSAMVGPVGTTRARLMYREIKES